MPWSGGVYTKANNATGGWTGDATAGIGIEAGRHDTQDNDFTTGITSCLNKDGSNAATGNLNIGNFKLTNLGSGSASTDSVTFGQVTSGVSVINTTTAVNYTQCSNDAGGPVINFRKNRSATIAGNTIVQNSDALGNIFFQGANGTGYDSGAAIVGFVDGTPGASADMPGGLLFYTSPDGTASLTERTRLKSNGQFLVGRSSAVFNTEVIAAGSGSGQQYITVHGGSSGTAAGGALVARNGTTTIAAMGGYSAILGGAYDATPVLYFNATPKVQGITSAVGDRFMKWSTTTNSWTYDTSSARFKDNIVDCPYGLDAVLAMQPRAFDYKYEGNKHDIGFVAEELVGVIPEVVGLDKDGIPEAVMYDRLTAALCKAIQELNTKVEALEARIAELEA
jgi:hypothetical protein